MTDTDPLAGLDFDVICAMTHYGRPCQLPAEYLATVHVCRRNPRRVPLCAGGLDALREQTWPNHCGTCLAAFNTVHDFVWNIEPL